MKYKVGDRVKVKSLQWFNENFDDDYNIVFADGWHFSEPMSIFCGKELIIERISHTTNPPHYVMKNNMFAWTDEMIEGLVEEEEIEFTEEDKYWCDIMSESDPTTYILPQGYIFKDENGNVINTTKIVLEKKKKEYPKTYEECCKVLNLPVRDLDILDNMLDTTEIIYSKNLDRLLNSFRKLRICRDAYWKIAGDWRPEFRFGKKKYCIMTKDNKVISATVEETNRILVFPTEEMRDAFKENFDPDIEFCKELL